MSSVRNLRRSKSMCSVYYDVDRSKDAFRSSDSSVDVYIVHDPSGCEERLDGELISMLERKIDELSDLFAEKCRSLTELRTEVQCKMSEEGQTGYVVELLRQAMLQTCEQLQDTEGDIDPDTSHFSGRARSLLDAIKTKQCSLDREIRGALLELLHSDDLRSRVVLATVESVRDLLRETFARDMTDAYTPVLERCHRRLGKHMLRALESAFVELEESTSSFSNSIYRTTRALRRTMERHQDILDGRDASGNTERLEHDIQEVLQEEMRVWRTQALAAALCSVMEQGSESSQTSSSSLSQSFQSSKLSYIPSTPSATYNDLPPLPDAWACSPQQPADPNCSIIDQMMMKAEIKKKLSDGDLNGCFEKALTAMDLSILMTACNLADPDVVFGPPCALTQPILLSLTQQLATDMVHETQLKCRYLEDALINLDPTNPVSRTHLPVVVGEVRKHLSNFVKMYPGHVYNRRIKLITMAALNLIK